MIQWFTNWLRTWTPMDRRQKDRRHSCRRGFSNRRHKLKLIWQNKATDRRKHDRRSLLGIDRRFIDRRQP